MKTTLSEPKEKRTIPRSESASIKIFESKDLYSAAADFRLYMKMQASGETHYDGIELDTCIENAQQLMIERGLTMDELNWYIQSGYQRCWDDSCDGAHCPRCGCHKIDFYASGLCQSCIDGL